MKLTESELRKAIRIVFEDFADEATGIKNTWTLADAQHILPNYKFDEFKKQLEKGVKTAFSEMSEEERTFLITYIKSCKKDEVAKIMWMDLKATKNCMRRIIRKVKKYCTFDFMSFFGNTEKILCLSKYIIPERWTDIKHDSAWRQYKSSLSPKSDQAVEYVFKERLSNYQRRKLEELLEKDGIPKGTVLSWILPTLRHYEEFFIYGKEEALARKAKAKSAWERQVGKKDQLLINQDFLTVRQCVILKDAGFHTIYDLFQFGLDHLREIDGIGPSIEKGIMEGLRLGGYIK